MEINKENETHIVVDTTDTGWKINGRVTKEAEGTISISLDVVDVDNEFVASIYYVRPVIGHVHFSCNVDENNRLSVVEYATNAVNQVLTHFQN